MLVHNYMICIEVDFLLQISMHESNENAQYEHGSSINNAEKGLPVNASAGLINWVHLCKKSMQINHVNKIITPGS